MFWGHNIVLRKELCKQKVFKYIPVIICVKTEQMLQLETAVKFMYIISIYFFAILHKM